MNDQERADQIKLVIEQKLEELSEYCDVVQILASWNGMDTPENTHSSFRGFAIGARTKW